MGFSYVDLETAKRATGLRMVVVGGVPSPWGEAAKGYFHVKGVDWLAVRLTYGDDGLKEWAGQRSGPVAIWNDEAPRSGAREILDLAESIAPEPALLPGDSSAREEVYALTERLLDAGGFCWLRRNQLVHAGLTGDAEGFPPQVAGYLGKKYGYTPEIGEGAAEAVAAHLAHFARLLEDGRDWLVGDALTAADIAFAASMALIEPLPPEHCAMNEVTRKVFARRDPVTAAAMTPRLLAHRDKVYAEALELPLSL